MVGLVYYWVCHMSLTQGFRPQPSFPRFWRNPNYDNPLIDWWSNLVNGRTRVPGNCAILPIFNPLLSWICWMHCLKLLKEWNLSHGNHMESLSTTVRCCSKSRDLPRPISCFCLCPYKLYIKDRHGMVRIPVGWTISQQPSGLTAPVLRFLRFPPPPLQPLMLPRPPPLFRCCPRLRRRHRLLRP